VEIGFVIAGHRIERLVGRGGMGVVYAAVDVALDRQVALKLIAPELAADPGFRRRFIAESRIAASLDHPNVVPIFRAGEEDGVLFLAMRLQHRLEHGLELERRAPDDLQHLGCRRLALARLGEVALQSLGALRGHADSVAILTTRRGAKPGQVVA
jgi:Protein kinase domain